MLLSSAHPEPGHRAGHARRSDECALHREPIRPRQQHEPLAVRGVHGGGAGAQSSSLVQIDSQKSAA